MKSPGPPAILEVSRLLESSRPQPRINWMLWAAALALILLLSSALASNQSPQMKQVVNIVCILASGGVMIGFFATSLYDVRRLRAEHSLVEQIGAMVQLRRWPDAAVALDEFLSRPARSRQMRAQSLLYLTSVLARLGRFQDAMIVQDHLLGEELLDEGTAAALKVGRAMAMLREDHLFDADRAINELRRSPAAGSAGLALVELYRDVKTGHPTEAAELFEQKLSVLRDQLGHRVADAYVLAARAYDLLSRTTEAQSAFHNATLLAPLKELFARYPETEKLSGRYTVAAAPPEAA